MLRGSRELMVTGDELGKGRRCYQDEEDTYNRS